MTSVPFNKLADNTIRVKTAHQEADRQQRSPNEAHGSGRLWSGSRDSALNLFQDGRSEEDEKYSPSDKAADKTIENILPDVFASSWRPMCITARTSKDRFQLIADLSTEWGKSRSEVVDIMLGIAEDQILSQSATAFQLRPPSATIKLAQLRRRVAKRRLIKEELRDTMEDIKEAEPELAKELEEAAQDVATKHGLQWPPNPTTQSNNPHSKRILEALDELSKESGKRQVTRRELQRKTGLSVEELEKAIQPLDGDFLLRTVERRSGQPTIWFQRRK